MLRVQGRVIQERPETWVIDSSQINVSKILRSVSECTLNFSLSVSVPNQLALLWNAIIHYNLVIETVLKCYSLICWAFPNWWLWSILWLYQQYGEIVQDGCSSFIVSIFSMQLWNFSDFFLKIRTKVLPHPFENELTSFTNSTQQ